MSMDSWVRPGLLAVVASWTISPVAAESLFSTWFDPPFEAVERALEDDRDALDRICDVLALAATHGMLERRSLRQIRKWRLDPESLGEHPPAWRTQFIEFAVPVGPS